MKYLRNLLRKLWPFVTRRELMEVRKELIAFDGQDFKILIREIDELRTLLATANATFCDRLDWLESFRTVATNRLADVVVDVARLKKPKKKPSRKKPAKKGKKK